MSPVARVDQPAPAPPATQPDLRAWHIAVPTGTPQRATTIDDVAREAGVNKGTVSRALRGVPGVAERTRDRILEVAERLNFSSSHAASALATGNSRTVGLVMPTLRTWYHAAVTAGATEVLQAHGLRVELLLHDFDSDGALGDPVFRRLMRDLGTAGGLQALLYASTVVSAGGAAEHAWSTHLAQTPTTADTLGVHVDNRHGSRLLAEHLLGLGHRRLVVVDGRTPGPSYPPATWEARTAGVTDALAAVGARLEASDVVLAGGPGGAKGRACVDAVLERAPTAVVCQTDELAFGLLAALAERGVRVPEQLSVVGFDGHPAADFVGLTTIDQHAYQQGEQAAHALVRSLYPTAGHPEPAPVELTLEVRHSVGPPPVRA